MLFVPKQKSSLTVEDKKSKKENLNLADLDLKKIKLTEEDALALSYLTPGLSRRIQKQLFSQLAPSELKKLQRTLSSRNSNEHNPYDSNQNESQKMARRSVDRLSSTLPRRYALDSSDTNKRESTGAIAPDLESKNPKSNLPVKSEGRRSPYDNISSSVYSESKSESDFSHLRPKVNHSMSLREPKTYFGSKDKSPDSSFSESLSRNEDSCRNNDSSVSFSTDTYSSLSRPSSFSKYSDSPGLSKYLTPHKTFDSTKSSAPNALDTNKTDIRKPSSSPRRISRFLRPDFFDASKQDNIVVKEKKEREMETQKVLKEIRDKRKFRLNARRERSASKEKSVEKSEEKSVIDEKQGETCEFPESKDDTVKETDLLLSNVSNNIRNLENNVNKNMHDYVNVSAQEAATTDNEDVKEDFRKIHDYVNVKSPESNDSGVIKKTRVSKLVRPKSYPTENIVRDPAPKTSPEKESKISRFRKGFIRQGSKERDKDKTKEDKNETNKNINEEEKAGHKNKLLQSIEKKLEKFRSSSSSIKDPEEIKALKEKKSGVENAIKRLREQSLPRNLDHCTESGLIKRAVSVEDLPNAHNKPLQASRKSVTKILGLFKKYEEQESKKNDRVVKKKKAKDSNMKTSEAKVEKPRKESNNGAESVINNAEANNVSEIVANDSSQSETPKQQQSERKLQRPRSLLLDRVKGFQSGGSKTDYNNSSSVEGGEKETKTKGSKLPVNSFRRSLNLDNVVAEPPKFYKNPTKTAVLTDQEPKNQDQQNKADRRNLKLDLSKTSSRYVEPKIVVEPVASTSSMNGPTIERKNYSSATITDDNSSIYLSPDDNNSCCDSWSVCSDYHTHDLSSPVSPNGYIYSGDEGESVIDRIRRKSFYTRFNEKKRVRKPSFSQDYKDLQLYKELSGYKSPGTSTADYGSLDRRSSYDYKNPVVRRSSYASSLRDPPKRDYKNYTRSSSLLNDYVNVPNRYQTYSSKIARPVTSMYSDAEEAPSNDYLAASSSEKYTSQLQPPRINRASISPGREHYYNNRPSSSSVSSKLEPPGTSEHV